VDAIVAETNGSREYTTRKVRDTLRTMSRKGRLVAMRKAITMSSGAAITVPAYREKGR
jgi:hypothetical protein